MLPQRAPPPEHGVLVLTIPSGWRPCSPFTLGVAVSGTFPEPLEALVFAQANHDGDGLGEDEFEVWGQSTQLRQADGLAPFESMDGQAGSG